MHEASMKTSLIIMAGGQGKRFGNREIKALVSVGPNGETIMDYSVHDAIKAGFDQIIIVINERIEPIFAKNFDIHISRICQLYNTEYHYVLERVEDVPNNVIIPQERKDPWGTGQAILACKEYLDGPFAVINADDFYGYQAIKQMYVQLKNNCSQFYITGYKIWKTLPEKGPINRGICHITNGKITDISETKDIRFKKATDSKDVHIYTSERTIPINSVVNMNLWGFPRHFLKILEFEFSVFFKDYASTLSTAEFLIPVTIGKLLREQKIELTLLESSEECFGLTHSDDIHTVRNKISALVESNIYRNSLYDDLTK